MYVRNTIVGAIAGQAIYWVHEVRQARSEFGFSVVDLNATWHLWTVALGAVAGATATFFLTMIFSPSRPGKTEGDK